MKINLFQDDTVSVDLLFCVHKLDFREFERSCQVLLLNLNVSMWFAVRPTYVHGNSAFMTTWITLCWKGRSLPIKSNGLADIGLDGMSRESTTWTINLILFRSGVEIIPGRETPWEECGLTSLITITDIFCASNDLLVVKSRNFPDNQIFFFQPKKYLLIWNTFSQNSE